VPKKTKTKLSWFDAYAAARMSGLTGSESGKVADEYTGITKPKEKKWGGSKRLKKTSSSGTCAARSGRLSS
jgi:hypothetical protein